MTSQKLTKDQKARVISALQDNHNLLEQLQTSEELHVFAWNWNWDWGVEPLAKLIRDPRCDRGTALLLYWTACPKWLYQFANKDEVPSWAHPTYELVKEIEEKYLAGFYHQARIAFNPRNDRNLDWTNEYKDVKVVQEIPEQMISEVQGERLDRQLT